MLELGDLGVFPGCFRGAGFGLNLGILGAFECFLGILGFSVALLGFWVFSGEFGCFLGVLECWGF